MFDGELSFSVLHTACSSLLWYSIVIMFVTIFFIKYFANPFRLCVESFSLTISGISLSTSGRLCLRHLFVNSGLALKANNSFFIRVAFVCTLSLGIRYKVCN